MSKLEDIQDLYRQDFTSFIGFAFKELYPEKTLEQNWHIRCLGYHLQQAFFGHETKLLFNLPPRTLKSLIISVAFTAWVLGKNPYAQILCIHSSKELIKQLEEMTRRLMISKRYRPLFPHVILTNNDKRIALTVGGFRQGVTCFSNITGLSADFIIMDDMMSATVANNDKIKKQMHEYYKNSVVTRLNDSNKSVQIFCSQRLHKNDMSSFLLKNDNNWKHISIPIISKQNLTYQISENKTYTTKNNEILQPKRFNWDSLIKQMFLVGGGNFMTQYQQSYIDPSLRSISTMNKPCAYRLGHMRMSYASIIMSEEVIVLYKIFDRKDIWPALECNELPLTQEEEMDDWEILMSKSKEERIKDGEKASKWLNERLVKMNEVIAKYSQM